MNDTQYIIAMINALIVPLGFVGGWEVVIIALIILLLFGGRKIPELMRGVGKGIKSFKEGIKDVEKEIEDVDSEIKK